MTKEELFGIYVKFYHLKDKYVVLKEDSEGQYIEYAFRDGAPHDNRCLSWYDSFHPDAIRVNCEVCEYSEEEMLDELKCRKEEVDKKIGKIFELGSFTCGFEEKMEEMLKEKEKYWNNHHIGEPFVPEHHVCRVGKPSDRCLEQGNCHSDWSYKNPCKCACWYLRKEIDYTFSIPSGDIEEFAKCINK